MTETSTIDNANKLGDLFNSWGKIAIIVGGALISCAIAYYRIFDNEKDIAQERNDRIEATLVIENRSDNRFSRAMETATKLEQMGMKLEERVRQLEKENAYMKGKYESQH